MATISECRYRWLRLSATNFVIAHSPAAVFACALAGMVEDGGQWQRTAEASRLCRQLEKERRDLKITMS
jgi:hypothetical protein